MGDQARASRLERERPEFIALRKGHLRDFERTVEDQGWGHVAIACRRFKARSIRRVGAFLRQPQAVPGDGVEGFKYGCQRADQSVGGTFLCVQPQEAVLKHPAEQHFPKRPCGECPVVQAVIVAADQRALVGQLLQELEEADPIRGQRVPGTSRQPLQGADVQQLAGVCDGHRTRKGHAFRDECVLQPGRHVGDGIGQDCAAGQFGQQVSFPHRPVGVAVQANYAGVEARRAALQGGQGIGFIAALRYGDGVGGVGDAECPGGGIDDCLAYGVEDAERRRFCPTAQCAAQQLSRQFGVGDKTVVGHGAQPKLGRHGVHRADNLRGSFTRGVQGIDGAIRREIQPLLPIAVGKVEESPGRIHSHGAHKPGRAVVQAEGHEAQHGIVLGRYCQQQAIAIGNGGVERLEGTLPQRCRGVCSRSVDMEVKGVSGVHGRDEQALPAADGVYLDPLAVPEQESQRR